MTAQDMCKLKVDANIFSWNMQYGDLLNEQFKHLKYSDYKMLLTDLPKWAIVLSFGQLPIKKVNEILKTFANYNLNIKR